MLDSAIDPANLAMEPTDPASDHEIWIAIIDCVISPQKNARGERKYALV
jgi:hypothetical protein